MRAFPERAAEAAFTHAIDAHTLSAICRGTTHFLDLMSRLPSIYPLEILKSLDRLVARGLVPRRIATEVRHQAGRGAATTRKGGSLLPLPHPLDFEWRFTPDASRELLDLAGELTTPASSVLLFGTPALALEALTFPLDRRVHFLAEDTAVTRRVMALNRTVGSPLSVAFCNEGHPSNSADAVLLDPPWYMDFIRPMLAAAAAACRHGGVVLISIAPDCTRSGAHSDRLATIRFASRLGLSLLEHHPLAIRYDTPFFEANALAAAGIQAPPRWRRGDLLVFRKLQAGCRPASPVGHRKRDWIESTIGGMRLLIRSANVKAETGSGLIPLVAGDILPSVSRRDSRRRRALVWTSGNRIFATDNPALVLEVAVAHSAERQGTSAEHRPCGNVRQAIERVAAQLAALAALEATEERAWRSGESLARPVPRPLAAG